MPTPPSAYTIARELLTANLDMPTDLVLQKLRQRGVVAPEAKIRHIVHETRSTLRKKAGVAAPKPTAAKPTPPAAKPGPKPAPAAAKATVAPAAVPVPPAALDLNVVFQNVTLVNAVVRLVGGPDHARKVAEAVRACGSVDLFLQHVDLVAGIRVPDPTPAA